MHLGGREKKESGGIQSNRLSGVLLYLEGSSGIRYGRY
jgi:hypothetical protein